MRLNCVNFITPEPKMRKGIHPKVDETLGFPYLGHSNWTICSKLSRFCSKKISNSLIFILGAHFLLPQRLPRLQLRKKGFAQKLVRHRGFCTWGIQTGPLAVGKADFVPQISKFLMFIPGIPFLITLELKLRKRDSPKNG